jgi:hypothetical protein
MNKTIKKVLVVALGALFTFPLASCTGELTVTGLENYPPPYDDYEINMCLIPQNMLNEYSYLEGDYFNYDYGIPALFSEPPTNPNICILYLRYSEEVYPEAKEYMLNNTDYTKEVHYTYNGYEFYENMTMPKVVGNLDENGQNEYKYRWFNMISYNDQNRTLVFLGFYRWKDYDLETMVQEQGWGAVLKEYFSYYDFDA